MTFQFIEVNPSAVQINPADIEANDGLTYNHLKRLYAKYSSTPAVKVEAVGKNLKVIGQHKYLAIAQELGFEKIQAIIRDTTFDQLRERGVEGLLRTVPNADLEAETDAPVSWSWHILFFENTPSQEVAQEITERFSQFLEQTLPSALPEGIKPSIDVQFDLSAPCLEMFFSTPRLNHEFAKQFRSFCIQISNSLLKIATYQGRRFVS